LAVMGAVITLTILSVREAPPPQIAVPVDQAAALYAKNCANCHGAGIVYPPGTDLHQVIAQGKHEGMPAWGGDLSTDEIDALAGFISSPKGSALYTQYCGVCHKSLVQASGNPQELQRVFTEGANYRPHRSETVPAWNKTLGDTERNALLNFLAAPDGQRLFEINCSGCHGFGVAFTGTESQLRDLISKGGQHVSMPAWKGTLSDADLETLAAYVADPASAPAGKTLFSQHCSTCHGDRVPAAPDLETARQIISTGGPHVTMPVWGNILTPQQLDALVQYTLAASKGKGPAQGAQLFASNCSACHGEQGQGGPNPGNPQDTIPPITSTEFLNTRDNVTLQNIISQGQPDLGMNPFGSAYGGQLSDDQINAIITYMQSLEGTTSAAEASAPTAAPAAPAPTPSAPSGPVSFSASVLPIFQEKCQACHNSSTKMGGWDASSYDTVTQSGDNGPVITAGDLKASLLAQLLLGTDGKLMPPTGALPQDEMLTILDWIAAGAEGN